MLRTTASLTLALCAALPDGIATCAAADLGNGDAPDWIMLMPVGAVPTNDGRNFSNPSPQIAIAASKLPGLIDFDHGTQLRKDSKAAGWVNKLQVGGPKGEAGVWGQVEWTPAGKEALASKLYRFFSPTFMPDAKGVVKFIVGGSLVNNPALDSIPALASTNQETTLTLEELLAKLRKALGLADTATADDIIAAITALNQNNTAATAAQQLLATGDAAEVAQLRTDLATLTTRLNAALLSQDAKTAEDIVEQGVKDGKIAPAVKAEMLALCKSDVPAFQAMLAKMPVVVGGRVQTPNQPAEGELTEDQLALCSQLNIKPEDYKKTLAAQKKDAA
jgi:phage I-like protein